MDPSKFIQIFFYFCASHISDWIVYREWKKKQIKSYRCDELYNLKTYNENVFNKLQICKTFH